MSQKNRRTIGGGTLAVLAVLFVALVIVVDIVFRGARLDLTENRLYTISEGTDNILEEIGEPINLYLYFSDEMARDLTPLRIHGDRVREMLEELAARADGMISLEIIDPLPFSEAEDEAAAYGLQSIPAGPNGENVFFGLVGTNALDDVETIPFFQLDKETFLEYELARLIHNLDNPDRPVVGLMSTLPLTRGFDPATRQMREPWIVAQQMEQLFEMRNIPTSATSIDDDVNLLVVVHPKNLGEQTLYAIDQFVIGGGKLIVFVDPHAEIDQPQNQMEDPQAAMFADRSSNLAQLFEAWGIGYDPGQVVLDNLFGLQLSAGPGQRPVRHIGVLSITEEGLNNDDITLANLSSVNVALAGHLQPAPNADFEFTPLMTTSGASATVSSEQVRFLPDPSNLLNGFEPSDTAYVIAARIQGPLPSAFPDGSPSADAEADDAEAETGNGADSAAPVKQTGVANIIVVADADMLADRMWAQVRDFFGQRLIQAFANNGDFVVNALENHAGSSDLISIRGRATSRRPFTRVQELERQAEDRFRETEQQLSRELQETERKLSELQAGREDGNPMILTPEQQQELERFRNEQLRIRKELRAVRANLRDDIEDLGTWLKVLNIGLIPLLLTILVLGLAWMKTRRRREA